MNVRVWPQILCQVNADIAEVNVRADDGDMSVEAQIGRQRYSQQTYVVKSYYGVGTEL